MNKLYVYLYEKKHRHTIEVRNFKILYPCHRVNTSRKSGDHENVKRLIAESFVYDVKIVIVARKNRRLIRDIVEYRWIERERNSCGHSSVKSTSWRGCHGMERAEHAGRAESRRHRKTSGCFEKVHIYSSLFAPTISPRTPFSPLCPVRRHSSPYRQWRLDAAPYR